MGEFRDLIRQHHQQMARQVRQADEQFVAEDIESISPAEVVTVRMTGDLRLTGIEFDVDRYHDLTDEELVDELIDAYVDAQNELGRQRHEVMAHTFRKSSEDLIRSEPTT